MHSGGVSVVTTLGLVDVIIGVDWSLAAQLSAQQLNSPVGDDLVSVHIGLSAGARLPDDEGEVIVVKFSRDDLVRSFADGISYHWVQAVFFVHLGGSFLQNSKGCQYSV